MNTKTHMIVMEVASQQLDQYKNNGLISKLHEILLGRIWVCYLVWFLVHHGFMLWLWNRGVNTVPYQSVYTIPASKPVRLTPMFRTGKNTSCTGQFRAIPAGTEKKFFFLIIIIF